MSAVTKQQLTPWASRGVISLRLRASFRFYPGCAPQYVYTQDFGIMLLSYRRLKHGESPGRRTLAKADRVGASRENPQPPSFNRGV